MSETAAGSIAARARREPARGPKGRVLAPVLGTVVGLPVMGYGVWGMLHDANRTHPTEAFRWIVGSALLHDLLFLPLVVGAGWLLARPFSQRNRMAVRFGVGVSAMLVLVSWPFVRGYGSDPTVPSLLSRNYAWGLAATLTVVWGAVGASVLGVARSRKFRRR